MARPKLNIVVLDPGSGKARPGAWVSFYSANTSTLTAVYADDDISTLANPVQANGLGQVAVRVNPGLYDISMTWDGAQPTVVEDVLAWVPEGAVLKGTGDLIVGGTAGAASRLPLGPEGTVLVSHDGLPRWMQLSSTIGLPAVFGGGLLTFDQNGHLIPIQPGQQDQALAMAGGMPTWVSTLLPPGTTLPINQPGDLVVGAAGSGTPARLGRGETDTVLTVSATGGLTWDTAGRGSLGVGQCLLTLEGSALQLQPYQGNQIWVAGRSRTIPGLIMLAPTGLAPDTTYYIYCFWNGTALQLEASTTLPTMIGGLLTKTGDESRTLVGQARTINAGGGVAGWVDSQKQRFVLSAFHPLARAGSSHLTAPRTLGTTAPSELHGEIRTEFLCWDLSAVTMALSGFAITNQPATLHTLLTVDGQAVTGSAITAVGDEYFNIACTATKPLPRGYHYVSILCSTDVAGAVTYHGAVDGIEACKTHVLVTGMS